MFYRSPAISSAFVLVFYRNFAAYSPDHCHVGLGVNALHTVRVLRKAGIGADLQAAWVAADVARRLDAEPACTHAIVEAPWVALADLAALTRAYPRVHFVVRAHSNVGFLQVEAGAIDLIRGTMAQAEMCLNLTLAANNRRLRYFLEGSYDGHCEYLPNLYDVAGKSLARWRPPTSRDVVKVASFGALRLMKNHTTGAAAALMVARNLGVDLRFHLSVNREEHGKGVLQAVRNLFAGLPWAELVEVPWSEWPDFRRTVADMDLCFQLSMSETFNITSADAAAAGIPSVVTEAIEWCPDDWKVGPDSVEEAARRGAWLLHDRDAGRRGLDALTRFNDDATQIWLDYLGSNPTV